MFPGFHSSVKKAIAGNTQILQRQLMFHYRYLRDQKLQLPDFRETGFRVYSQCDEDGLLLYVFSLIGTTDKRLVDVAFANPEGANTTNLICNWGWHGVLVHADNTALTDSGIFFGAHPDTMIVPPKMISQWVTAENINILASECGLAGGIDFFSLDIDGVDYWIWKALEVVRPRVVVVECQTMWGPEKSVTVPYRPDFDRLKGHPDFFGASLNAFVKLGREKGYRLVGCNRFGYNAIFIINGVGEEFFPEIQPEECFRGEQSDLREQRSKRLSSVEHLGWVPV